jgi:hypothetical protein
MIIFKYLFILSDNHFYSSRGTAIKRYFPNCYISDILLPPGISAALNI